MMKIMMRKNTKMKNRIDNFLLYYIFDMAIWIQQNKGK